VSWSRLSEQNLRVDKWSLCQLDALVRGRGGDSGHDASRHIRGNGEVRDRAVAPLCIPKLKPGRSDVEPSEDLV
jgi:hypothetical protein